MLECSIDFVADVVVDFFCVAIMSSQWKEILWIYIVCWKLFLGCSIYFCCYHSFFSSTSSVPPYFTVCSLKRKKKHQQRNAIATTKRIKSKKNNRIQCLVVSKCITMKLGSIYYFVIFRTYPIFDRYFDVLFALKSSVYYRNLLVKIRLTKVIVINI